MTVERVMSEQYPRTCSANQRLMTSLTWCGAARLALQLAMRRKILKNLGGSVYKLQYSEA
jgi:hypothetical protein